ncbi:hypothetical protein [Sphingomonas sp.]|uniref:hypothetical protein n=1 Tax=Sphingomonas sp. TaxID=28214 RepID=UPI0031D6E2EC
MDIALAAYFEAEQAGCRAVIERCGVVFDEMAKRDLTASLDGLPTKYQTLADGVEAMGGIERAQAGCGGLDAGPRSRPLSPDRLDG